MILLDVNMPGLDGLETAQLIRNRRKSAHTPIIFITADFQDDAHSRRGYALGAVDYIGSPVVPEILRAKVQRVRRPVPARAPGRAAGAAASRARRGEGGAHGGRALDAAARVPRARQRGARRVARRRGDDAGSRRPRRAAALRRQRARDDRRPTTSRIARRSSPAARRRRTSRSRPLGEALDPSIRAIDRPGRGDRRTAALAAATARPAAASIFPTAIVAHSLVVVPLARARHARSPCSRSA